ncbi:MAG TPA: hypothetical protein PK435_12555 [Thermoanaerobaculaceae bacterium]|nr:hypothetical protein [Thermoanaerobaculaceae bacterium]
MPAEPPRRCRAQRLHHRLAAAGVPAAPLLGGDAEATPPFVVHGAVAGSNGVEWSARPAATAGW